MYTVATDVGDLQPAGEGRKEVVSESVELRAIAIAVKITTTRRKPCCCLYSQV